MSTRFLLGWCLAASTTTALCVCNPPATMPPAGVAGVEPALCVLDTYSHDKAMGLADGAAIADTIARCATDAATIARVLDASHAAEMRIQSPPPLDPEGGSVSIGQRVLQEVTR